MNKIAGSRLYSATRSSRHTIRMARSITAGKRQYVTCHDIGTYSFRARLILAPRATSNRIDLSSIRLVGASPSRRLLAHALGLDMRLIAFPWKNDIRRASYHLSVTGCL